MYKKILFIPALLASMSIAHAQIDQGGLLQCTTVSGESYSDDDKTFVEGAIGEKFVLGYNLFGNKLIVIYKSGASPVWNCKISGMNYICHFDSIDRDAVFNSDNLELTLPYGFRAAYTVSKCAKFEF